MFWGLNIFEQDRVGVVSKKINIDVDDILEKSREISDFVNNKLMKIFYEIHGIDEEYGMLNVKQEIVAKTSYFPDAKKKYCMRIINKEGKNVDKIEVKGIVVRRSDYPSATKDKMSELINMLLSDNYSLMDIKNFVRETCNYMTNLSLCGDYRVGRPVSYNKSIESYKKVPYHVIGMQLWNELEYKYFFPGSKGYMFRIKGIDFSNEKIRGKINYSSSLNKSNYIVMPIDMENLPPYYEVDVNETVKFSWLDRVGELIDY